MPPRTIQRSFFPWVDMFGVHLQHGSLVPLVVQPDISDPPPASLRRYRGPINPGSFIIVLKETVSKNAFLGRLLNLSNRIIVTHPEWRSGLINGFAGEFPARCFF